MSPGKPEAQAPTRHSLRQLREQWLAPLERDYVVGLLRESEGDVDSAAEKAGVNRVTMYRRLKKRGVRPAEYRPL